MAVNVSVWRSRHGAGFVGSVVDGDYLIKFLRGGTRDDVERDCKAVADEYGRIKRRVAGGMLR